jgi:DNA-binding transcriptional ArsR family regulator
MAKIAGEVGYQSLPLPDYLARLGRQAFERSPGGPRPRHLIALKLLEEHGPLSQQTFGERLSLDPSNVVGLLNELEERGLISRRRDLADRRRTSPDPRRLPDQDEPGAADGARVGL